MENYKEMYFTLFHATTRAIELLQNAQLAAEDIYISEEEKSDQTKTPQETL